MSDKKSNSLKRVTILKPWKVGRGFATDATIVPFRGDAREFLRTLPNKIVSLVVTSPPYNIGKVYEERASLDQYRADQSRLISELHRVLKDDGSVCWQVGSFVDKGEIYPLDLLFYDIFKLFGFKLRNRIIWHYRHGLHASRRFSGRYETILWFTKGDEYAFNLDDVRIPAIYPGKRYYKGPKKGKPSANPKGKNPSDVWEIISRDWQLGFWDIPNVKAYHPEKTIQPCQFPVELAERCVLALTKKADWVLDPYAGVGSTLVAAAMHGRRSMGSEKERKYYNIILQRLEALRKGDLRLRPLGRPVHVPTGNEKVAQIPDEWNRTKRRGR
ncbi:MAG: site-specific DNA-methyltransferase [Ignavibacteriales bacterium]|nr:site-specific DNA-methyltransferase [Ignavibacteriales bacterium]